MILEAKKDRAHQNTALNPSIEDFSVYFNAGDLGAGRDITNSLHGKGH
jgi:hypothetical protein